MFDLLSDHLTGPLGEIREKPFAIRYLEDFPMEKIGFIGDTYAGKNQAIKELVYSLGGLYQEAVCCVDGRTEKDSSYIFAESITDKERTTSLVGLKSHRGDRIKADNGPKMDKNIIVLKYLKSSTFNNQIRKIEPILSGENISYSDCVALITRVSDPSELTVRRRNMLNQYPFKTVCYTDNKKKKDYSISTMNAPNIESVIGLLRESNPTFRLIYFGKEEIPTGLEDKITHYDSHFPLDDITPEIQKEFDYWKDSSRIFSSGILF